MDLPAPLGPGRAAAAPLRALAFILRHPGLWWLSAAPLAVNTVIFGLFYWLVWDRFQSWVGALIPTGEGWWWAALFYLLVVLVSLSLAVVLVFLMSVLGGILAAPFLELLTRRTERIITGRVESGGEDRPAWAEAWRVARQEFKKLVLYFTIITSLLALNLFPGPGTAVYTALAWLVTAYFLALEFLDYPLDRRGLSLGEKMAYVWRLRAGWLGFGAAVFLLGVAPLLNLALLPLAAVGGTLVYLDRPAGPGGERKPPEPGGPGAE